LDAASNSVRYDAGSGVVDLRYDVLVLALGSRLLTSIAASSEHATALSDSDAAQRLAAELVTLAPGERVVVVGGGLTAIELSAEIAEVHPHLEVELLAEKFVPDLEGPARDALQASLADVGVRIRERCSVRAVTPEGATLADGTRIDARISVLAAGFRAAPLDAGFGLPTRSDGRIEVDEQLRAAGLSNVFVAGDLCAPPASRIGTGLATTRMACATAMPLAAHVADQVARYASGAPLVPYRFSYSLRCISVGRRRGVVVFVDADDRPTGRVLRGRAGALVKETICRLVIGALRLERALAGAYAWQRGSRRLVRREPARISSRWPS
jgi:NADH dehydrogenase FAD-containing subunit